MIYLITISNFINKFLQNSDIFGIFATYHEAIDIIEKYDDAFRVIENMK